VLAFDQTIRIYGIVATNTVKEMKRRLNTSVDVTEALGRLAMGSLFIGALDSNVAKIYTTMNGGGPIGTMYADSDGQGNVRAYATNPQAQASQGNKSDEMMRALVGREGFFYVMKDLGLKQRFTSQTALVDGTVRADIAQYFAESQQTETALDVDVLMQDDEIIVAGGFIAQALPGASAAGMEIVQASIAKIASAPALLAEMSVEEMVLGLTAGTGEVLETFAVQFHCSCSKERFLDAFATLPEVELREMLADEQDEEVICQYCGEKYYITNEDLTDILQDKTDSARKDKG